MVKGRERRRVMTKDMRVRKAVLMPIHQADGTVFTQELRKSSDHWEPQDWGAALVVLLTLWRDMGFGRRSFGRPERSQQAYEPSL